MSVVYCEMCGAPITPDEAYQVVVEGARMVVCERCYMKIRSKQSSSGEPLPFRVSLSTRPQQRQYTTTAVTPRPATPRTTTVSSRVKMPQSKWFKRGASEKLAERYEVVPDFAERVRRARERLGMTQEELAIRVRESVNVIKRIEAGTLVPTVDLARRLEKVLGIKLLEPVVEEYEASQRKRSEEFELTLGDIVEIREE